MIDCFDKKIKTFCYIYFFTLLLFVVALFNSCMYSICEVLIHNIVMTLQHLLAQFDLTLKQADAFVYLYQYGPKPASTIAKAISDERTNTYKMLELLVRRGLIAQTEKKGVKEFFVADKEVFRNLIQHQQQDLKAKEFLLPQLEQELSALQSQHEKALPLMRFFEGKEGIEHLFQDMQHSLEHTGYLMIKAFVSNTLQAQSFSGQVLDDFGHDFFEYCKKHQISIQALRGQGILMLEQIDTTLSLDDIRKAPAGA
jgi:predicted transcriptional regulator